MQNNKPCALCLMPFASGLFSKKVEIKNPSKNVREFVLQNINYINATGYLSDYLGHVKVFIRLRRRPCACPWMNAQNTFVLLRDVALKLRRITAS